MKKRRNTLVLLIVGVIEIALVALLLYVLLKDAWHRDNKTEISISALVISSVSEDKPIKPTENTSSDNLTGLQDPETSAGQEDIIIVPSDSSIFSIPFEDGYEFPNLAEYDFVFIGDSIFDMSFSDTSMPRQLEVYTGSRVYNLSKNMSCAGNSSNSQISLTGLTECFVKGQNTGYSENRSFNRDIERFVNDKHKKRNLVIVFNHCINDYTFSSPISNGADPYDINSYEGALRTNISKIKNAYSDAVLVYMEPYIPGINNGCSDPNTFGYNLNDYRAALERIAGEYGVMLWDLRSYAFFAEYRDGYLLDDYIHPNDMASKTMARLFCDFVQNNIAK